MAYMLAAFLFILRKSGPGLSLGFAACSFHTIVTRGSNRPRMSTHRRTVQPPQGCVIPMHSRWHGRAPSRAPSGSRMFGAPKTRSSVGSANVLGLGCGKARTQKHVSLSCNSQNDSYRYASV